MALCTCKCLNLRLRVESEALRPARFVDCEQRDPFFREELMSCGVAALKLEVAQPALTSQRPVGPWLVHACLTCGAHTHATRTDRPDADALINKAMQTSEEAVNKYKISSNFSPVFKLLVPEITTDEKENTDVNKMAAAPAVNGLSKQLSSSLQCQLERIEESIRMFRDQKYAEYEEFRERAHRDHKILASIVQKAKADEERRRAADGAAADGGGAPLSPSLPPLQRRRLSSFKDAKKLKQNTIKSTRNMDSEEDSLNAEDIFDLEGYPPSNNGNNSEADDYDSDESGSRDEGIHVRGPGPGRTAPAASVARSLPMRVPSNIHSSRYPPEDEEEPQDIAASIKELARSVHAGVFGELPRPRFSTQI